jgi:hypothetical protein
LKSIQIFYKDFEVSQEILKKSVEENLAFRIFWKQNKWNCTPLTYTAKDGSVFKLAEPANVSCIFSTLKFTFTQKEPQIEGPIMYFNKLKMQRSRDYKTTTDFSALLARAAGHFPFSLLNVYSTLTQRLFSNNSFENLCE